MIDTYSKNVLVKLYDRKNALVAADILNDKVKSLGLKEQEVRIMGLLTD